MKTSSSALGMRIARPDLLLLLNRSRDFALTLVMAPAGFGKSTLLDQWVLQAEVGTIVRLNLTRRDSNPVVCLQRLSELLRQSLAGFTPLSCNELTINLDQANLLADSLAESLAEAQDEFFLLIDDFHYANTPLIQHTFARLLDQLPEHVHLIIASRSHPGFPLSRLKLADRLLTIDNHDLRLPAEQLTELCATLRLPPLTATENIELLRLTEGWVAGVKLALLARPRNGSKLPMGFNGALPELMDYFVDAVLEDLPSDLHDVLLGSAIFEKFNADLCLHLLDAPASLLEQLLQKGLFIQPLEDMAGCYRYHPLFQRFLQVRLEQENPQRLKQLHLAATHYFLAHGDGDAALYHARLSEQADVLIPTLRAVCNLWFRQGKLTAILENISLANENEVITDPELFVPQLSAMIFTRQFNQAQEQLDHIDRHHHQTATLPTTVDILSFMKRLLASFTDDPETIDTNESLLESNIAFNDIRDFSISAQRHILHGKCDAALRLATESQYRLTKQGQHYLASFSNMIIIWAEREQGHALVARQMTLDFFNSYADQPKTPGWVNAGACMAISLYEQNRIAEARVLCEALIMHVDSACSTRIVFYVYVALIRLYYIDGRYARSSQLLLQLRRILQQGNYSHLLNLLLAEEMGHALRTNNLAAIKGIAADHNLTGLIAEGLWNEPLPEYREGWVYGGLAAVLYLRQRKQYERALDILQTLGTSLANSQMKNRQVVVEANRITILSLQGRDDEAMQALGELFARVGIQCAMRSVFDEAPGFGDVMLRSHRDDHINLPDPYLDHYSDVLQPPQTITAVKPEQLTNTEQKILDLLRQGLSNKDISNTLEIAITTTKWHLKNIFAKLKVSNRMAAIVSKVVIASVIEYQSVINYGFIV